MADEIEIDVFRLLKQVDIDELHGICDGLKLVIPTSKKENTNLIVKVMRYLHSEDMVELGDEGLSIFLKLRTDLQSIVEEKFESDGNKKIYVKPDVNKQEESLEQNFEGVNKKSYVRVQRLREFKINGTVGDVDQKNTVIH